MWNAAGSCCRRESPAASKPLPERYSNFWSEALAAQVLQLAHLIVAWSLLAVDVVFVFHATVAMSELIQWPVGWIVTVAAESVVETLGSLAPCSPYVVVLLVRVRWWRCGVVVVAGVGGW